MQPDQNRFLQWAYTIGTLAIVAGIILTAVSWLKLCSGMCNDAHNYRLFDLPFEVGGAVYFAALAILHFLIRKDKSLIPWMGLLIAAGLGSELYFIILQKVQIGSWCPVCLSIAGCIAVLGICYLYLQLTEKIGGFMRGWVNLGALVAVFGLGFTTSFFGVSKIDQLQAAEDQIKERIKFGNRASPVEVYVFTDWACPACRAVEPALEAMAPNIMKHAQITFVDTVVHPETLNFAPYNIAFMVSAKPKYFEVRDRLTKLSLTNKKPNDQDIEQAVASLRVRFQELPYEDVSVAMRYFEELADKFKVTGTPTVAIVNPQTKKGKKLAGAEEISEANIIKAIDSLK